MSERIVGGRNVRAQFPGGKSGHEGWAQWPRVLSQALCPSPKSGREGRYHCLGRNVWTHCYHWRRSVRAPFPGAMSGNGARYLSFYIQWNFLSNYVPTFILRICLNQKIQLAFEISVPPISCEYQKQNFSISFYNLLRNLNFTCKACSKFSLCSGLYPVPGEPFTESSSPNLVL